MLIRNNTSRNLFVTGCNEIFPEETYIYSEQKNDSITVGCECGHIIIACDGDNLRLLSSGELGAICRFDSEKNDFLVTIFYVGKPKDTIGNSWFVQQDKLLHDKELHDASTNLTSAHIVAYRRIDELTDAIKKSIQKCVPNQTTSDVKQIRNWAKEIMFQCNIIDSIYED